MSRFIRKTRRLLAPLGNHTPVTLSLRLALALSLSLALHAVLWLTVEVAPLAPARAKPALSAALVMKAPVRTEPAFMLPPYLVEPLEDARVVPPKQETLEPLFQRGPFELAAEAAATPSHPDEQPALVVARPDAVFYSATEVDRAAVFLNDVMPEYPPQAHADGIEGHVDVRVFIDEAGFIRDVAIDAASPPGFFEQAAISAFKTARFTPAYKNEQPVKSQKKIRIWFGLTDGGPP